MWGLEEVQLGAESEWREWDELPVCTIPEEELWWCLPPFFWRIEMLFVPEDIVSILRTGAGLT